MLTSALPFFLKAEPGERFCLYHEPHPGQTLRGAVLYVHPFAEELNRTRRMAALQSRAFAAAGYAVLQIDLFGCGDSSGDFGDARLAIWHQDLAAARRWLQARTDGPLLLWGLRLGALLALDFAAESSTAPDAMLLWQPVLSGAGHLRQFQRIQSASRMMQAEPGARAVASLGGAEVAGYQLAPELSRALASLDAQHLPLRCPLLWLETGFHDATHGLQLPLASDRLLTQWRAHQLPVSSHVYAGQPFWSSTEVSECPALLASTAALFNAAVPAL